MVDRVIRQSPFIQQITEVVSGGAQGVDSIAILWAVANEKPYSAFRPDWATYGIRAGILRNETMAVYGDALIAIWDEESRGTKDMIQRMVNYRKAVYIYGTKSNKEIQWTPK